MGYSYINCDCEDDHYDEEMTFQSLMNACGISEKIVDDQCSPETPCHRCDQCLGTCDRDFL